MSINKAEVFRELDTVLLKLALLLAKHPNALAGLTEKQAADFEIIKKSVAAQKEKMTKKADKRVISYSVLITDSPLKAEKDSAGNIIKYTATRVVVFIEIDDRSQQPTLDYENIYANTEGYILKSGQVPTVLGSAKGGTALPANAAVAAGIDIALTLDALVAAYKASPDTVLVGTITWTVNSSTATETCYHYKITDGDYKYNESAKTFSAVRTVSRIDNPNCEPSVIEYENLYKTGSQLKAGEIPVRLKSGTGKAAELPAGTKTSAAYSLAKIEEKFKADANALAKGVYTGKLSWEVEEVVIPNPTPTPRPALNVPKDLTIPFRDAEAAVSLTSEGKTVVDDEIAKIEETLRDNPDITVQIFVTTPNSGPSLVGKSSNPNDKDEFEGKTHNQLLQARRDFILASLSKTIRDSGATVTALTSIPGLQRIYYIYTQK